ncbi:TonB-dependent receptor [Glaciecola petra]|uniref:TonB-dependent receptor n=1 Tax=Glaciecola petra TaxID=3075602 RepID=A0ABU2ZSM4_9ALTE|nr:TonB-dependent receptor [Aestuariibacter sp. P117]MDT0595416.1 TonB-dependent receptor [Aestuariibacter sp. P117]
MKLSNLALCISIACASSATFDVDANTIKGKVTDENGKLLTTGSVQIMGTNKRSQINSKGEFEFLDVKPGSVELHVSSSNHIHSSEQVDVVEDGLVNLNISVDSSSIEVFDVTASAFHASNIESAAPVSILAGEKLRQQQASTLGETLKNQVGVHSSFYGGVVSSPIIRGLDGPRVLITQNGMDGGDASRIGPDHLVTNETSSAEQIEVLRGPATLFYGSGAIGGVVNVVDTRIPDNTDQEGEFSVSHNTNNSEDGFNGRFKTGTDNIALQVQAFYRDADDYQIPGFAESPDAHSDEGHDDEHEDEHDDEHEEGSFGVVENTAARTQGAAVGASYLFDAGHIGFSMEHMSSLYGIPGHGHGEEHEEEHDEEHDDEHEGEEEEIVMADLRQNRYQLAGAFQLNTAAISAINFGLSYTDYEHTELENNEPGTNFSSESFETRMEILHQPIAGWRGGVSLHTKMTDFAAVGEEAFTPPSDTKSFGLGIIEEKHFGDVLVQLGARIERVQIDVPRIFEPEIEFLLDEHHDDDHEDEHDDEHGDEHDDDHGEHSGEHFEDAVGFDFTPVSLSAGLVWDIAKGYNLAASFVHAKRAPSSAELFSFGPHIGTQTYEIGSLYHIEQVAMSEEAPIVEFEPNRPELETSNNLDISWRKFGGDFGAVINVFYNQVDNYYYLADTGLYAEFSHEHEDEHDDDHDEIHEDEHDEHEDEHGEEGLPVFAYVAADTDLYGAEVQFTWQAMEGLTFTAQGDYIRAKVSNGNENLPRIPPIKAIIGADYKTHNFTVSGQITRMFEQDRVAAFETTTDAYTLVDINASYFTKVKGIETELFLKGRNLSDEEARVHTSFLKNLAPLPGRAVEIGVRMSF